MKYRKKKDAFKTTAQASEKLAKEVVADSLLDKPVEIIAKTQEKITGKKSWFGAHTIDFILVLGLIWCIFRTLDWYYPNSGWSKWVQFIEVFLPTSAISLAILYCSPLRLRHS